MTKAQAEALGADLKKQLGEGWGLDVFENLGWHVSANRGPLHVSLYPNFVNGKHGYSCLISSDPLKFPNCGDPIFDDPTNTKIYFDPIECVKDAVTYSRKVVNKLAKAVESGEAIVKDFKCPCCKRSY